MTGAEYINSLLKENEELKHENEILTRVIQDMKNCGNCGNTKCRQGLERLKSYACTDWQL